MDQQYEGKGVCFFAYNNEEIDYVKLATLCARYVKHFLNVEVCLITDEGSYHWLKESQKEYYKEFFDYVVITDDQMKKNVRNHFDSPWTQFPAQFSNSNKHRVYEYSPFEQTLLLDIDYIVKTDFLNRVWELEGVAMFDKAASLRNDSPHFNERYLYDAGVKMWWSTVIYFDRSNESKLFFDLWSHVAENYDFYQFLYNFPGKLFRTDYCVSVATHILNGMIDSDFVNSIDDKMYYMDQKDDWIESHSIQEWIMLANDLDKNWENILCNHRNLDVHVMNKRALDRQWEPLMEYFNEL